MATAKGSVRSPTLPSPSLAHFYDQQARFAPEKKRLLYSTTPSSRLALALGRNVCGMHVDRRPNRIPGYAHAGSGTE